MLTPAMAPLNISTKTRPSCLSTCTRTRTIYPGTGFAHQVGEGYGKGYTINVPMLPYAGKESYRTVFEEIVLPVANEYKPQIIIRNGGSDPHIMDGLTSMGLEVDGFKLIGEKIKETAQVCDGKVVDLIASGYNMKALPNSWLALICGLADIQVTLDEPVPCPPWISVDRSMMYVKLAVKDVKVNLKAYWKCLR
jgi:acetoin utilization protein AcuC